MSRDFKEIFDLARLRRAWGDAAAEPPAPPASGDDFAAAPAGTAVAAPPAAGPAHKAMPALLPPLVLLAQLDDAVAQEFPAHAAALRYHLDILRHRLQALVGESAPSGSPAGELPAELATAYHADVQENLDQLEDLIDALSLPAKSGD